MILITDGGSTKCDWILLDNQGEVVLRTKTLGLNPTIISEDELYKRIQENKDLVSLFETVDIVDFYGSGCGTDIPKTTLRNVIEALFTNAKVQVYEDTAAAVYAATDQPGIVCILGTGSNSCYYDGKDIHLPIESLGYILMDEASGNYYGKRLIRDYYYKKMPKVLASEFEQRFDLNADVIKINIYKKAHPNMYLASFAEFIFNPSDNRPDTKVVETYFYKLLQEGINSFIETHVLCFKEAQQVPIHFIGSIAHFSKDIILDCMKPHHLQMGTIIRRPIEALIEYYKKNKL